MKQELNALIAQKVLDTVDHGLVCGLGTPTPGGMCIEAAVCYAYGLPHGDNPPCVGSSVRAFKIALNDKRWSSPEARAKGMRGLAIAQLGSDSINQIEFSRNLSKKTIQKLIPKLLRLLAGILVFSSYQTQIRDAALACEKHGTKESALGARDLCRKLQAAAYANYAAANAANYAALAANAANYAANYADYAANAANAANYAALAANAANYAADAKIMDNRDSWLSFSADICLEVLKEMDSPGCKYLYLLDK